MATERDAPTVAHAPHPPLQTYFTDEAERRDWVRGLFDRTACDYDRLERVMAFGSGARYRRGVLVRAGLARGMHVVDVGTGTGLVAREAVRILGDVNAVIGVDPSPGMLANARVPAGVRLLDGAAEAIALPDASVEFLSMGYALRHISDLAIAFGEFRRVLRPGGILSILEITRPESRFGAALLKVYLRGVVPALARILAKSADGPRLMRYHWDTIEACVSPQAVVATLTAAGFVDVTRHVELGVFSDYRAIAPRED